MMTNTLTLEQKWPRHDKRRDQDHHGISRQPKKRCTQDLTKRENYEMEPIEDEDDLDLSEVFDDAEGVEAAEEAMAEDAEIEADDAQSADADEDAPGQEQGGEEEEVK